MSIILSLITGIINFIIELPFWGIEHYFSKKQRIKRKIKKTRLVPLSEVKTGKYVKLQGVAIPHEKMVVSPLKKKKCIGYKVFVGRENQDDYIDEEIIQNFYLTQGNRKILIMPRKANVDLKMEQVGSIGLFKDATPVFTEFLQKHQSKTTSFGFNKSLSFMEGVLEQGKTVSIVGKVTVFKSRNKPDQIVIRHLEDYPVYMKVL